MIANMIHQRVTLSMTLVEFRQTVEWLEGLDPYDGATKDWRKELDRIDPLGASLRTAVRRYETDLRKLAS